MRIQRVYIGLIMCGKNSLMYVVANVERLGGGKVWEVGVEEVLM